MVDTIRFQLFLATFAGWVCRSQPETENSSRTLDGPRAAR
jgi:hypothetical protein